MALHNLNPADNRDAAMFNVMVTKRLTATGAAAVNLDHVTKDRESRGRYAIGAVHKLNAVSGSQYVLTNRKPFGIGITGRSTVALAKDRPDQLRMYARPSAGGLYWFGDLVLVSHAADFAEVAVEPPKERDEVSDPLCSWQDCRVARPARTPFTASNPDRRQGQHRPRSLQFLILDGYVSKTTPHKLLKPYRPEEK